MAITLLVRTGLPQVLQLLRVAGWRLLWLVPLHVVPLACYGIAWGCLLRGADRPSYAYLTWAAIVREAVSGLLPVARIGGEVVGVRLLTRRGVPVEDASASVIVELSLTIAAQTVFAATGLAVLVTQPRATGVDAAVRLVFIGLLVSVLALVAFVFAVRRWGARIFGVALHMMERLGGETRDSTQAGAARFHQALERTFAQPRALAACGAWQLAGFFLQSTEPWVTLHVVGAPATVGGAIVLESMTNAVQSALFLVPAGLGSLEGTYLLFGSALGLSPQVALALSLARRVRTLLLSVPALVSWYWVERQASGAARPRE